MKELLGKNRLDEQDKIMLCKLQVKRFYRISLNAGSHIIDVFFYPRQVWYCHPSANRRDMICEKSAVCVRLGMDEFKKIFLKEVEG